MNKQELKEELHNLAFKKMHCKPDDLKLVDVLHIVDQLDEPQKVVIPQFVAEWIEECKDANYALLGAFDYFKVNEKFHSWLHEKNSTKKNQETFARAWLDGYTIEREKLYTVKIPNASSNILHRNIRTGRYIFHSGNGLKGYTNKLTESEIRKDFDWAWQAGFAKEVG